MYLYIGSAQYYNNYLASKVKKKYGSNFVSKIKD